VSVGTVGVGEVSCWELVVVPEELSDGAAAVDVDTSVTDEDSTLVGEVDASVVALVVVDVVSCSGGELDASGAVGVAGLEVAILLAFDVCSVCLVDVDTAYVDGGLYSK
jgi:hypothetical protein